MSEIKVLGSIKELCDQMKQEKSRTAEQEEYKQHLVKRMLDVIEASGNIDKLKLCKQDYELKPFVVLKNGSFRVLSHPSTVRYSGMLSNKMHEFAHAHGRFSFEVMTVDALFNETWIPAPLDRELLEAVTSELLKFKLREAEDISKSYDPDDADGPYDNERKKTC